MTKQELMANASAISGLTRSEIRQCVTPFIQALSEAFLEGEDVYIRGLGTFLIKDYPERNSRNPRTGEAIVVPPKKVVRFNVTPEYRSLIGKGKRKPAKDS
ncbi:HU family DNA-binding protein [Viscerimonas tarda]